MPDSNSSAVVRARENASMKPLVVLVIFGVVLPPYHESTCVLHHNAISRRNFRPKTCGASCRTVTTTQRVGVNAPLPRAKFHNVDHKRTLPVYIVRSLKTAQTCPPKIDFVGNNCSITHFEER